MRHIIRSERVIRGRVRSECVIRHKVRSECVNLELQATSRGTFYVLYNDFFKNDTNYPDVVKIQQHRVALTRLRIRNHRLAVESGSWHKPHVIALIEKNVVAVKTWRTNIIFYLSIRCILNYVGNIYLNTFISVLIC